MKFKQYLSNGKGREGERGEEARRTERGITDGGEREEDVYKTGRMINPRAFFERFERARFERFERFSVHESQYLGTSFWYKIAHRKISLTCTRVHN